MVFWALPESMQPAFAAALPEAITLPMPQNLRGEIAPEAFDLLSDFIRLRQPSLMVLGPGMGESPLLPRVLTQGTLPLVADADALNALARQNGWDQTWPRQRPCIFTPHPGEMARLLGTRTATDETTRKEQAEMLCQLTGSISILKGAGTLVCAQREGQLYLWQNTTGGPALAKAGSGDVLSGVIAGLWAQLGTAEGFNTQTALKAALCGVYLHGLAGDLAAVKRTDYGVLAGDTADYIPQALLETLA